MSNEVELAVIDSLKRQITEAKRQIDQIKNRNKAKFLEIRRMTDQRKARIVLSSLKLKKQVQDFQAYLEESRKQWDSDLKSTQEQVWVNSNQKYEESLKLEKSDKISQISQIISILTQSKSVQNDSQDTIECKNISSGDITIEQECSTDIVYLSTYLKAVIEGSTLDQFSKTDKLTLKLLTIAREIQKYLKRFIKGESLKTTKTSNFKQGSLKHLISEVSPVKVVNQSEFSFSSPDIKDQLNEEKNCSVSSDWKIEGDLVSESSQNPNDSGKWNSISVINVHTSSISQGSEASESAELLTPKSEVQLDRRQDRVSCFRKIFCCMCKSGGK